MKNAIIQFYVILNDNYIVLEYISFQMHENIWTFDTFLHETIMIHYELQTVQSVINTRFEGFSIHSNVYLPQAISLVTIIKTSMSNILYKQSRAVLKHCKKYVLNIKINREFFVAFGTLVSFN